MLHRCAEVCDQGGGEEEQRESQGGVRQGDIVLLSEQRRWHEGLLSVDSLYVHCLESATRTLNEARALNAWPRIWAADLAEAWHTVQRSRFDEYAYVR